MDSRAPQPHQRPAHGTPPRAGRGRSGDRKRKADLRQRDCAYCLRQATAAEPNTVDHVVPVSRGGNNHHLNLLPACRLCNGEKGNQTAIEWAVVLAHVGDYRRAQRALAAQARADRLAARRR